MKSAMPQFVFGKSSYSGVANGRRQILMSGNTHNTAYSSEKAWDIQMEQPIEHHDCIDTTCVTPACREDLVIC